MQQQVTLVSVAPQPMQDGEVQESIVHHDGTYTYWQIVRPGKYQPVDTEAPEGTIGVTQLNDGQWVWIVAPEVPKLCGICKGECEYN